MEVDYAVLCDACSAEAGKHHIHGGGWEVVFTDSLPLEYPQICVAARLLLDGPDRSRSWDLELDVLDPDDHSVLPAPARGRLEPRGPDPLHAQRISAECVAFRAVYARLSRPGSHAAVLRVDGAEVRRLPFSVVQVQPQSAAASATPRSISDRDGEDRWLWSGPREDSPAWLWRPSGERR